MRENVAIKVCSEILQGFLSKTVCIFFLLNKFGTSLKTHLIEKTIKILN